eukprot:3440035-Pyramimonas_sp.AAC.1
MDGHELRRAQKVLEAYEWGSSYAVKTHTKSWNSIPSVIALSSGEAAYVGAVNGSSVGLGIHYASNDVDLEVKLTLESDTSA